MPISPQGSWRPTCFFDPRALTTPGAAPNPAVNDDSGKKGSVFFCLRLAFFLVVAARTGYLEGNSVPVFAVMGMETLLLPLFSKFFVSSGATFLCVRDHAAVVWHRLPLDIVLGG